MYEKYFAKCQANQRKDERIDAFMNTLSRNEVGYVRICSKIGWNMGYNYTGWAIYIDTPKYNGNGW